MHPLEATYLRDNRYAVRPVGALGTCGWLSDGRPWAVIYVTAPSLKAAVRKAQGRVVAFNAGGRT